MRISGRRMRKPWHYRRDCDSWRTACQQQGHENDAENFRPCAPLSASRPASVADDGTVADIRKSKTSHLPYFQLPTSSQAVHTQSSVRRSRRIRCGALASMCITFGGVLRRSSSIACRGERAVFDFVPTDRSYTFFVFGARGGGPPRPGGTSVKCVTITQLKSTS